MEKLLELLLDYLQEKGNRTYGLDLYNYDSELKKIVIEDRGEYIDDIDIFRLLFGTDFIHWLVEHGKLDIADMKEKLGIPSFVWYVNGIANCIKEEDDPEQVLMFLAIQSEPIKFLLYFIEGGLKDVADAESN